MKTQFTLLLSVLLAVLLSPIGASAQTLTTEKMLQNILGTNTSSGYAPQATAANALVNSNRVTAINANTPGTVTVTGAVGITGATTITGTTTINGGTALTLEVEDRTATVAGATTGTISSETSHVTVSSSDANHIIILPAPVVGKQLVIHGSATGFELRSSDPATIAINGGTGAAAESAITANLTVFITCVSATSWKGWTVSSAGVLAAIQVAAP